MTASVARASRVAPFGYRRTIKPRFVSEFAEWATENGCTHAITITPDLRPSVRFDAELELKPMLRRLAKAIAHDVRDVPKRQLGTPGSVAQTVWMAGVVELHDEFGNLYPHFHGAVALRRGEEDRFRGVLGSRWGKGRSVPALRPVLSRTDCYPDFDLEKITDPEGWFRYSTKSTSPDDLMLWTHAELLGNA